MKESVMFLMLSNYDGNGLCFKQASGVGPDGRGRAVQRSYHPEALKEMFD